MNYTELKNNIQDIMETSFTDDHINMFLQLAENKIYQVAQIPALRKNTTGAVTASNPYLTLPTDFLYPYSVAIISATGAYEYAGDKDVNFIREAYPDPTVEGKPKYYAMFDENSLLLGPTPDAAYSVELHYGYYPESIVTAGNTWLGDNFDNVLLNGALVEAARFQKAEQDIVAMYDKLYLESLTLLKSWVDGKLRQDTYRVMQPRTPVT